MIRYNSKLEVVTRFIKYIVSVGKKDRYFNVFNNSYIILKHLGILFNKLK